MTRTVYLCGPMEAVSFDEASTWRNKATELLSDVCTILDPCRRIHSFEPNKMRRIFELDLRDIRESDILLVNLDMMFEKPSHGTAMEIFYGGFTLHKQIVAFKSKYTKPHPFIESLVTEWRSTVEKACDTIRSEYL
jgi:nucleoside 2-deoxyribosyltransferase